MFSITHMAQIQVPRSCSAFSLFLPGFVRSCFAAARLLSEEHDWFLGRRGRTSSCCLIGCSRWFHAHFGVVNNLRSVRNERCFGGMSRPYIIAQGGNETCLLSHIHTLYEHWFDLTLHTVCKRKRKGGRRYSDGGLFYGVGLQICAKKSLQKMCLYAKTYLK